MKSITPHSGVIQYINPSLIWLFILEILLGSFLNIGFIYSLFIVNLYAPQTPAAFVNLAVLPEVKRLCDQTHYLICKIYFSAIRKYPKGKLSEVTFDSFAPSFVEIKNIVSD